MKTEDLSCPRCFQTFLHKSSWKYHVDYSINCVAKKSIKEKADLLKHLAGPGPDLLPAADLQLLPELEEVAVFAGCLEDSEPSLTQPCSATRFCSTLPEPSETRLQELKEVGMMTDSQRSFDVEKQVGEGSKKIDHQEPSRAGVVS